MTYATFLRLYVIWLRETARYARGWSAMATAFADQAEEMFSRSHDTRSSPRAPSEQGIEPGRPGLVVPIEQARHARRAMMHGRDETRTGMTLDV